MGNKNHVSPREMKEVPDSIEDITPDWCEKALRHTCVIGPSTTVSAVDVKRFKNEETGVLDGGGMTQAKLLQITLNYGGQVEGYNPPSTIIAKALLSGQPSFKVPLHFPKKENLS